MKLSWRLAAIKLGLKDAIAYRTEFLIEVLGSAAVPAVVQIVIWYAVFKIGGATEMGGMNYSELLQYTMASVLFSQVRGGNLDFELQDQIRTGTLSQFLLKPMSMVEYTYYTGFARRLLVVFISLLIGLALSPFTDLDPLRMFGAMLLALLGNVIHYQIGAALSSVAFYWEEAYAILMVKNVLVGFLSGEIIPLNLIPEQYAWIWKSLPFHLYVFGPAEFALGKTSVEQFISQVGTAGVWIVGLWAVIHYSWKFSMKRYLSIGG